MRIGKVGWEFGGHADAAAKASDKGGAVDGEILLDNITTRLSGKLQLDTSDIISPRRTRRLQRENI